MSNLYSKIVWLDCTFRDGGYYNSWDFDLDLTYSYFKAMSELPVNIIEIGFRSESEKSTKFKGACAYCSDDWLRTIQFPKNLDLAVMINGADLLKHASGVKDSVRSLFVASSNSPVQIVRMAIHVNQVRDTLPAINILKELGYKTTVNLMQIAGLSHAELTELAMICSDYPIDVLYFADSLGGMVQDDVSKTVSALRTYWDGVLGFHGHNNMERALPNSLRAIEEGVAWVDSTMLGMGRGPGNTSTEYIAIEFKSNGREVQLDSLLNLHERYFKPMQKKYNWGPNPYYYMAGKYNIHPTYIQEMLQDKRYDNHDVLSVINHLKKSDGKRYSVSTLESARHFFSGPPRGTWSPVDMISGRSVLILGAGPSVYKYRSNIEHFIQKQQPFVMALNTQENISAVHINARVACHPVRMLADHQAHMVLPQPLITPVSMLPEDVASALANKSLLDFGLGIKANTFLYSDTYCVIPTSLVIAYALAIATSGQAKLIYLAGFDGYDADDPRTAEMIELIHLYKNSDSSVEIISITPSRYPLTIQSVCSL